MEIFAIDRIAGGNTALHRIDGRIKTGLLLGAIIITTFLTHWFLLTGVWLIALVLFHALKLPWRLLLRRLYIPFGIAWLVFLDMLFTYGKDPLFTVSAGPVALTAYREGLMLGILTSLRIIAAVTLGCVLTFSTPMIEILETLRSIRMPGLVIDLAAMMYRYVFVLDKEVRNMRRSQLSRMSASAGWLRQAGDMGKAAGNLMAKSLDRSAMVYKAMLARGYDENSSGAAYYTTPVPAAQWMSGLLIAAAALAVLLFDRLV